jgi:hypothetical protein
MSKRALKNRSKTRGGVGKTIGRSRGPLVWCEELNRKTTSKIFEAIKKNK